jgi:hypothetical protein
MHYRLGWVSMAKCMGQIEYGGRNLGPHCKYSCDCGVPCCQPYTGRERSVLHQSYVVRVSHRMRLL